MKIEKNIFSSIGFANGFSGNDKLAFNLLPSKGVPLGQTGPPRRIGKQGGRSRKTASAYSLAENHIGFAKGFSGFDKIASPLARLANDKTAAGYAPVERAMGFTYFASRRRGNLKTASAYSLAEIHIGLVKDAVKLSKILPFSFFVFAFAFAF